MKIKSKKSPSIISSSLLLLLILFIIIYGVMIANFNVELVLITAGMIATIFAIFHGEKWENIINNMSDKISSALTAILVLYSIGLVIGTWMMSGTIPYLIYYGLELINPQFIYVIAFLTTSIVSISIGSSFSSVGTVGVAIMGVAIAMNSNLAIVAGAIVSGGYFGDKLSPLSDTVIMSSLVAKVNVYDHIKNLMYTSLPAMIISVIVFFFLGININASVPSQLGKLKELQNIMSDMFNFNILLLIPPIIIIIGSIMKKSVLIVLFLSSLAAMLLSFFYQDFPISLIIESATEGFNVKMLSSMNPNINVAGLSKDIKELFNRGGLSSMSQPVLTVFCAFYFAASLELSGSLKVVLDKTLYYIKSITNTILVSLIAGLVFIFATGNSYVSFFLMKMSFEEKYKEKKLHSLVLSRSMEDSGMIPEALVPWTVGGIYMASTLNVSVFDYAPWAMFNFLGVVFSALLAILGPHIKWFGIKKDKIYK
jgi:NhaC family Na+:H+ antiporter